ncbi:MAG: transcriptional regulator, TetR family [Solirubrobacterales bacterium]|jgi:AcrR family transcriptional regulator|nr:transcriptional regulator, TetR family [Solirubrobacterales bacterium]
MGLRERKREQTRQALADAALELFAEHGYDATTIAAIAARADVSPRTFFSHHPSKEHVLFCEDDETLASLGAHLAARPPGQPTLDALRDWIGTIVDEYDFAAGDSRERLRRRVIEQTPVLLAHEQQLRARFEVVIRAEVAVELGDRPEDLRPRLVAAAATAALESTRPQEGVDAGPAEALARVDAAMTFLRGGLRALQGS